MTQVSGESAHTANPAILDTIAGQQVCDLL